MTASKKSRKDNSPSDGTAKPSAGELEAKGFDERLAELEQIATALESGDLALEQALERYKHGVQLLRSCRGELEAVREQVSELSGTEGAPDKPLEFDPDVNPGNG